jgi:hypothetical protein
MHQVKPEQAAVLRLVRQNLSVAADEAEEMEGLFEVPQAGCDNEFGPVA